MILDRIDLAEKYFTIHAGLHDAFEFLRRTDYAALPDGRHEIDGKRLYLIMNHAVGRGRAGARLEAHRKYIDVQIPINAPEEMGWLAVPLCRQRSEPYDEQRDVEFFADPPKSWITVSPGDLIVFFPHDAHAPLVGAGVIHKAVLKIAVDW
jgi:YhcH/YjgK/YiaL family protein